MKDEERTLDALLVSYSLWGASHVEVKWQRSPLPLLFPRLKSVAGPAPQHYSRQEVVSALTDFYEFLAVLPHIDSSAIDHAPPGG